MKKNKVTIRNVKTWLLYIVLFFIGLLLLIAGPILINYLYLAEARFFELAFTAGELLVYYGAVLGGLAMALTIIITVHINRLNITRKRQHAQFERAYEVYHKLPEILSKLDITAVHVHYLVRLSKRINEDEVLIETLDTMEEARTLLYEYNYINSNFYNKHIWKLLQEVITVSEVCHNKVDIYLQNKECVDNEATNSYKAIEDAFSNLRVVIKAAKKTIVTEINKLFVANDDMRFL